MSSIASSVTLLAFMLAVLPRDAHAQRPTTVTAFVNVSVIPMDSERILSNYTVVVRDGHIVTMEESAAVRVPAGATIIDGQGKFLMPGLADMHMHFDPREPIEPLLMLYVANGITTIRSLDGSPEYLLMRDWVAQGKLLGPRIYLAGNHVNTLKTVADAETVIAEHKADGYDLIKLHDDQGDIDPEVFDSFAAAAHLAGIPFAGHVPTRVGLARMLRAHPASVEHLYGYLEYVVGQDTVPVRLTYSAASALLPADDAKIREVALLTKQAGVWNCPTLLISRTGAINRHRGPDRPIFEFRWKVIKALHDVGAGLLLGTDGGTGGALIPAVGPYGSTFGTPPQLKIFPAFEVPFELALFVEAGLTPYQALETATRNPAVFLGTLDSTGTIAVGKRADLVLLRGNPLMDVSQTKKPVGTMVGGQWYPREMLLDRVAAAQFLANDEVLPKDWYR